MYKLKLIKGSSYTGNGISATKAKPFVDVSDAVGKTLVETGYFSIVKTEKAAAEDLSMMTKAQIIKYAQKEKISIKGCTTKAEMIAAISAAGKENDVNIDLRQE